MSGDDISTRGVNNFEAKTKKFRPSSVVNPKSSLVYV